jgi:glycosyltransferase involved in cell wall biosynthesis
VAHTQIIPALFSELLKIARTSVIHLHIGGAFAPEIVYAAYRIRRLPYVAHFHGDVGPSGWAGFLLRAYNPLVLGPVLRAAAVVVVPTEDFGSTVSARYGVDPARIAVIANGVDDSFIYTGQRRLHTKPRLLFVGRLSIQKNLPLFLHALDGISEQFETTLVGDGELEGQLKCLAAELRLLNVRFHGRADGAELRNLYRNADVFVLPSQWEGMPLVLLEALAMGLPIVATDITGNREVVVHGENGLLVPLGDSMALRQGLLNVTADPGRYRYMSKMSQQLARKYSWPRVGAELERVYAQARNRAPNHPRASVVLGENR